MPAFVVTLVVVVVVVVGGTCAGLCRRTAEFGQRHSQSMWNAPSSCMLLGITRLRTVLCWLRCCIVFIVGLRATKRRLHVAEREDPDETP